ncbi:MAG: hypothetical protein AAF432_10305 [Planctomycetota bacterium]
MGPIIALFGIIVALLAACFAVVFILVPVLKGTGWLIVNFGRGVTWLVAHIFEFITGMIGDTLRFIGAVIASIVLIPMVPLNVILGRWSAAGHFARAVKREASVGTNCLYRFSLRRPLKLVMLHGLLEGLEQRVPEAMAGAPTSDRPKKRSGQYRGYNIVGSLKGGGSGAKLYIAEPDPAYHKRSMPDLVVIKAFALHEGSSLPQIVRESRALEGAKKIGLVLDHEMDEHRFFYVMPYHPGEHLGVATRQLHGETAGRGLEPKQFQLVMGYMRDLLATLTAYHDAGLWHKDVKPDNIIIDAGEAHLVDLGLVTPLRSAMTLTTHGTEYFRDPEMVRQALRGVKVHQIDGTKFDVYAAGAVLYFMLENTFPAHGGLSRFSKKSPEALRWIVRRAMADYHQRYASADEMLADLLVVAASSDAYDVKPVALPSMNGGAGAVPAATLVNNVEAVEEAPAEPVVDDVAAAQTPMPPAPEPQGPFVAAAASVPAGRPRIKVTNWWTGAYKVEEPKVAANAGAPASSPETEHFRRQAEELRQQAWALREQVKDGTVSARDAARSQLKNVRHRAKDVRKGAKQRMAKARATRRKTRNTVPMFLVGFLCLLTLGIGGLAAALVTLGDRMNNAQAYFGGDEFDYGQTARILIGNAETTMRDGKPVLLVNRHPGAMHPQVIDQVATIMDGFEDDGYVVIHHDFEGRDEIATTFMQWIDEDGAVQVDMELESLLDEYNLYGLLDVYAAGSYRQAELNPVDGRIIHAERSGAASRRWFVPDGAMLEGAYLLVNDHPRKLTEDTSRQIEQLLVGLKSSGVEPIQDIEREVALRSYMLPGQGLVEGDKKLVENIRTLKLDGLIYIYNDNQHDMESITVHVINADDPELKFNLPNSRQTSLATQHGQGATFLHASQSTPSISVTVNGRDCESFAEAAREVRDRMRSYSCSSN